jgi:uncharacterized protein YggE
MKRIYFLVFAFIVITGLAISMVTSGFASLDFSGLETEKGTLIIGTYKEYSYQQTKNGTVIGNTLSTPINIKFRVFDNSDKVIDETFKTTGVGAIEGTTYHSSLGAFVFFDVSALMKPLTIDKG